MKARPLHWFGRFLTMLWPRPASAEDTAWAERWLSEAEVRLWRKMSVGDQRHALGVARATEVGLGGLADDLAGSGGDERAVMAAALLHDVGKTAAGLGVYGRSIATLCGLVASEMAEAWQAKDGFTRKVGLYLRYGEIGADQLRLAGSHPWVVAWSTEHHLPPEDWSLPRPIGELLVAADR